MLATLSIKNYALIDQLNVRFDNGFTVITGETGAGKSILLGGLSLVLGKRADLSTLRDDSQKCIVEAEFDIENYTLEVFFKENDLDYEVRTIIRREIMGSGKSRAFINDTPVTLSVLSSLGNRLIDVHSQHQTLQLSENDFQLRLIDALAKNNADLQAYSALLQDYSKTSKNLDELIENQSTAIKELDYNSFLLEELEKMALEIGMQEELEEQYEQLNNVETIVENLSKGYRLLNDEQMGVLNALAELKQISGRLAGFGHQYVELDKRIRSVFIEMDDLAGELTSIEQGTEANPNLLEEIDTKLRSLYDLQKKHGVVDVEGLLAIKEELSKKVVATVDLESKIEALQGELESLEKKLEEKSMVLRDRRNQVIPDLTHQLQARLGELGMPNAQFKIGLTVSDTFKPNGKDDLTFLFSANKGMAFGELKKVASGGELSRIMLTIKSILAKYEDLPTIMFDEIDAGVSGEISNRMAEIMHQMSKTMQVFSITHLPQVASKGDHHFKVFKLEDSDSTNTKIKKLNVDQRVVELAEMLGGKELSDSAMAHARQLLN